MYAISSSQVTKKPRQQDSEIRQTTNPYTTEAIVEGIQ